MTEQFFYGLDLWLGWIPKKIHSGEIFKFILNTEPRITQEKEVDTIWVSVRVE